MTAKKKMTIRILTPYVAAALLGVEEPEDVMTVDAKLAAQVIACGAAEEVRQEK